MAIEIRRLLPGDAAVLERVADDVFDAPIDPERLAAYLADPGHLMIIAIHDGEVVGQAMAVVHRHPDKPTELYVDEVVTTPRGKVRAKTPACAGAGSAAAPRQGHPDQRRLHAARVLRSGVLKAVFRMSEE